MPCPLARFFIKGLDDATQGLIKQTACRSLARIQDDLISYFIEVSHSAMQFIMQPILVCVIFWEVRGRIWCSVSSGAMGGVSLLNVICSDSVIYNL